MNKIVDNDNSGINLQGGTTQPDINKVEVDDLGLLNAYKYCPLPSLEFFSEQMKTMNIKTYDDVILYSQMPMTNYQYEQEDEMSFYKHLLGIYRA